MQANSADPMFEVSSKFIAKGAIAMNEERRDESDSSAKPMFFQGQFANSMEMLADVVTVTQYLDEHQGWFCRCARPMTAESLGDNGYALTVGRFRSFGYEVEPKVGLCLLPADNQGVYRINTVDIPDHEAPGYHVDFNASMQLVETQTDNEVITLVEWELDLKVQVHFPRFIYALPKSLVQGTGDRLLNQIVRQVSKKLTHKVQDDFHSTIAVPFPKRRRRAMW
ncbi:MAG: DUF1997 domain-containing protein [Cyanothece sp. SIO2G6]|nr:DUF1997 domain-containing protein [Cyanothece sp. SIO2G6]